MTGAAPKGAKAGDHRAIVLSFLRQSARYLATTVGGLAVDLGLATALATLAGLSLVAAAFFGFLAGLAFNFVVHTLWTFGGTTSFAVAPSMRVLGYLIAIGISLAVRIGVLSLLQTMTPPGSLHPTLQLFIATGFSFVVGFLLLRSAVFRRNTTVGTER